MNEDKACLTGMTAGGVLGFGTVAAATLAVPVIGPMVGAYLVIGGMIGGIFAGGHAGLKIAETVNNSNKGKE